MCGICGVFFFDPSARVDQRLLKVMNGTLVHRGPDDEGYYLGEAVGLAMRRLSIIDLDSGHQPICNEDGTVWVVYNGEIYNYPELRADLAARGHILRTRSDTEVIVHLYEEHGEELVRHLNGMFALALWDARRHRLILARDRMGIKPLYYSLEPGRRLVFGSEIKALLPAGVEVEPDYQALSDYLSLMYVPTPATAYKAIRKLPPGSLLVCTPEGVKFVQYWDIPLPAVGQEPPAPANCGEYVLDLIQTAVRRQMIADVPVGAFLSGGLDSTTVTAVMTRKLQQPIKTFTIGFDRSSYDESAEARLVAETLGTEHHEVVLQPAMIQSIDDLLDKFDQPFADYSALPTFYVAGLAARQVKVVLTGDGGDEVFAGYLTHLADRVARFFRLVPRLIREKVVIPLVMALPTSLDRISFDYMAKRFVTGADLPLGRGHYWWKVIFNEEEKKSLCSAEWQRMGLRDTYEVFDVYFEKSRQAHPLNRLLYVDAKTFLLDDNLTKVDQMTMANSLEARVPLLDHELIEAVAVLPPQVKLRGWRTKRLLRQAGRGLLPPQIRRLKKKGFTPPLPYWIRDELKGFVLDSLSPSKIKATGLLDPDYCRRLLDEHFHGLKDNNRQIWTLVAMLRWLEHRPRKVIPI